jgi:hypothetical protein
MRIVSGARGSAGGERAWDIYCQYPYRCLWQGTCSSAFCPSESCPSELTCQSGYGGCMVRSCPETFGCVFAG